MIWACVLCVKKVRESSGEMFVWRWRSFNGHFPGQPG